MALIKSISGIRGTIGGRVGEGLSPVDAVKFAAAYGTWLKENTSKEKLTVVIGRDARISGEMIQNLVISTLQGLGIDVINLDFSTTPTVEVAVPMEKADGGIILTASHNPKQWNALKLLNAKGEFVSGKDGERILELAENDDFTFAEVDELGTITEDRSYVEKHIQATLDLPLVDVEAVKKAQFKVVVDAVNSTGGIFVPALLEKMGVTCVKLYCDPTGHFPHDPEPLKEHLTDISAKVVEEKADLGIVVDPDVDRLALICEDGSMFGEEYTLVAVADYVLSQTSGNTVSNMSSSRALRDVTQRYEGCTYEPSAVGEVNVVEKMKATNAIIGGEGNGGIIYPALHYGRDSIVGIALFLTHLAKQGKSCLALRQSYPDYYMSKNKVELTPSIDVDAILQAVEKKFSNEEVNIVDGVKIDFAEEWAHLRKSNTEPIIRIYTEAKSQERADALAQEVMEVVKSLA